MFRFDCSLSIRLCGLNTAANTTEEIKIPRGRNIVSSSINSCSPQSFDTYSHDIALTFNLYDKAWPMRAGAAMRPIRDT